MVVCWHAAHPAVHMAQERQLEEHCRYRSLCACRQPCPEHKWPMRQMNMYPDFVWLAQRSRDHCTRRSHWQDGLHRTVCTVNLLLNILFHMDLGFGDFTLCQIPPMQGVPCKHQKFARTTWPLEAAAEAATPCHLMQHQRLPAKAQEAYKPW